MGRWTIPLTLATAILCACGAQAATEVDNPVTTDTLFVPVEGGLDVISAASGDIQSALPGGIASPDYSVLAYAEPDGDGTTIRMVDPAGAEIATATVAGEMAVKVVSPSGKLVAVGATADAGSTAYVPAGRSSTTIEVLGADGTRRSFDLQGNFEPEAFSTDDEQLFLIEYVPALAPTRYRVRRLLLRRGRVYPIGRLKSAAPGQMQGTGRTQVYSPDNDELYTLYTQQDAAGHDDEGFHGKHAFVHLLNLDDAWTHCIDLPASFGSGAATASAIAITPDGSDLFVVDWTEGIVADAQPENVDVVRHVRVDFGAPDERTYAVATGDRLYVAGGSEVVVLNTSRLREIARWPMSGEITGLILSDDAEHLYVSTADVVDFVDATTGRTLHEIDAGGALGVVHAAPPAG